MNGKIKGLHHVTALASSARGVDGFFTGVLGLRRVKTTVNFDAPQVYHLYYGDTLGRPGTVMTHFPFPQARRGRRGLGEVSVTAFAIPKGTATAWAERLCAFDVAGITRDDSFGAARLLFDGPDGERLALVEAAHDRRDPWTGADLPEEIAILGFHSVEMMLAEVAPTAELLQFMGYRPVGQAGAVTRLAVPGGNGADIIDLRAAPDAPQAAEGAGSVHHVAFAVENRARQIEVRTALVDAGWDVTPVIDRDYFHAIYFRTPGGVLFEVATNEPGFASDEDEDSLGTALKLPGRHEHLRARLEKVLEPLAG